MEDSWVQNTDDKVSNFESRGLLFVSYDGGAWNNTTPKVRTPCGCTRRSPEAPVWIYG